VIDIKTSRDHKGCSRALVAVFWCCSRLFQPESGCGEKSSARGRVLKRSFLLTGSTDADRVLGRVWRAPACRRAMMFLSCLGMLAFLLSAILPDDDAIQQEFLHSRASVRVVGRHTREVAGNAASVCFSTAFAPTPKYFLVRRCGIAYPLFVTPLRSCGRIRSTIRATRAPPTSV
jgi:hypothetical protein